MEGGGAREPLCSLQPRPPGLQVCLVPSRPPCLDLLKSWGLRAVFFLPCSRSPASLGTGDPKDPGSLSSIPACFHVADPSWGSKEGTPQIANPGAHFSFFLKPLYPQPKRQCPLRPPSLELCIAWVLYLCITDVICTKGSS